MDIALSGLLFLLIFLFIVVMFLNIQFYKNLKNHHYEKWIELGEPEGLKSKSIPASILLNRFQMKREYLLLNDKELNKIGFLLNMFYAIHAIIFFVSLLVFFF